MLFGHMVGDFFLQGKNMAIKKGTSNLTALNHVAIYTLAVLVFTLPYYTRISHITEGTWLIKYYLWVAVIFIPHFIIDRFSLADVWLKFINGRSLKDFYENGHKDIPKSDNKWEGHTEVGKEYEEYKLNLNYKILRGSFTGIVYVCVDNTAHLMCLWYGWQLIFN